MCTTCGKHNAEGIWYLDEERHRIRSLGRFRDGVSNKLNPLITVGLKLVRRKQPDYVNSRMGFVSRAVLDWFAKTLHGMQFLPDIDSAFKVIDMANELALVPCLCRRAMDPEDPPVYRCIAMNIATKIYFRPEMKVDARPLDKEQAKQPGRRLASEGRLAERGLAVGRQRDLGLQLRRALRRVSGAGGRLGWNSELRGLDPRPALGLQRLRGLRQLVQAPGLVVRRPGNRLRGPGQVQGLRSVHRQLSDRRPRLRAPADHLRHHDEDGQTSRQRDGVHRLTIRSEHARRGLGCCAGPAIGPSSTGQRLGFPAWWRSETVDHGERKYWNMEIEPKLNTPEIKELQLEKLKQALAWQYENTPFNRARFEKAGARPEDIQSFEDFAAAIPVAGQEQIREVIGEDRPEHGQVDAPSLRREEAEGPVSPDDHLWNHRHPHALPQFPCLDPGFPGNHVQGGVADGVSARGSHRPVLRPVDARRRHATDSLVSGLSRNHDDSHRSRGGHREDPSVHAALQR